MTRVSDEPRQGIRGWVKRHPVASFFVLAYAISWLASIPAALGYGFMFLFTQFGPALLRSSSPGTRMHRSESGRARSSAGAWRRGGTSSQLGYLSYWSACRARSLV
jgi:hypothetical protein